MLFNSDYRKLLRGKSNSCFGVGFTLIELLVVISIIGLVLSIMLPALNRAKSNARRAACMSNLRQLGFAFLLYAMDFDDYAMPTYDGSDTYWWGRRLLADGIDPTKGFIWPYLKSELKTKSVYECPEQPYGSYGLQGKPAVEPDDQKWITSTYGYNGYYLCPPQSGWESIIGFRPWQKITTIQNPGRVIAFADTLIDLDVTGTGSIIKNTALLDPPYWYERTGWEENLSPTTCFRHNETTNAVFVDGHCESMKLEDGKYTSPAAKIGSITAHNGPYYVPDYKSWPIKRRRRQ